MEEFNAYSSAMDEILQKLAELQRKNNALLRRYNGDAKFARVHKRIREENVRRKNEGKPVILSEYDESIVSALMSIKGTIDLKVYTSTPGLITSVNGLFMMLATVQPRGIALLILSFQTKLPPVV